MSSRYLWTALALVSATLTVTSCSSSGASSGKAHSVTVTPAQFGEQWPLTVQDSGVLSCDANGDLGGVDGVYLVIDGTTYAVNGTALNSGKYPAIDPIWAKDPTGIAPRKDIGVLIDKGLSLC